eukprot:1109545-Pyramimonas_sp.AAC.1
MLVLAGVGLAPPTWTDDGTGSSWAVVVRGRGARRHPVGGAPQGGAAAGHDKSAQSRAQGWKSARPFSQCKVCG